jgi:hypothetical protein
MNYLDAQKILNSVRDGADYPVDLINKALEMTGDISGNEFEKLVAGMRSTGVADTLQKTQSGVWCARSEGLVVIDDPGHRETQGQTSGRSTAGCDE